MATDFIFVKGKGSWIRAQTPDKFGNFKLVLHPDEESLNKIRDLQAEGLKNVIKKDEDGYYVRFSRPQNKMIKGKLTPFHPPKIFAADGSPADHIVIGNGSDVTVKLAVYSHSTPSGGKAKAARWESLRIDNLVPYEKDRDFEQDQEQGHRGFDNVEPQKEMPF